MRLPGYLFFVLILSGYVARAQRPVFGNEWINYQQTYYKISVAQKGLYRVTVSDLQKAGLPLTTLDPRTLQLFHRGVEQAILVEGEADGTFDAADYIEFIGRGNDGVPDSALYRPASAQPHALYSLFSDTTAYFLTARADAKPGRRMARYTDTDYAGLTPEPYHWADELRVFTDTYPGWASGIPNKIEYSHFEAGEGYTGPVLQSGRAYEYPFTLTNPVRTGPAPQVEGLFVGREYANRRIDVQVGEAGRRLLSRVACPLFDNANWQETLAWSDVGAEGKLLLTTNLTAEGIATDRYSVTYLRVRYPQQLTAAGQPYRTYQLPVNTRRRSLLEVTNVPANTRFWDLTDSSAPVQIGATTPVAGSARLVVSGTDQPRTVVSASQPITGLPLTRVRFTSWEGRRPTYLIVSHESLMQPGAVPAYAAYRASAAGGSHDTLTVTMQQLYDQFSYGERHPTAVVRFADQLLRRSAGTPARPRYLLFIGRARSTPGIRRDPKQAALDMVMTYGFPGSDVVFTAGLDGQLPNVPAIPTGRINAGTPQEVLAYLQKVREFEALPAGQPWRKNVLHLSGGASLYETSLFRSLVDTYRDKIRAASMGAAVTTMSKKTDNLVEQIDVVKPVNDGVGLITFFGHSGLDVTDLDIGFSSNAALGYQNKGKYPMLLINGCATGNFFFGRPTLSSDWLLTPDKGAIAVLAQSHLGYITQLDRYTREFYGLLTDSTWLDKPIGQLQQETIRRVLRVRPGGWDLANTQQMVLQGDPALRLFPFQTPDYSIAGGGVTVRGDADRPLTILSDSVRLTVVVQNYGQYRRGALPVRVRRIADGRELGSVTLTWPRGVALRDTLTLTLPNEPGGGGTNQFEVTINPTGSVAETNRDNNRAVAEVVIAGQGPVLIYPPLSGTVSTRTVRLTAESFATGPRPFELELDSTARFDSPARLAQRITTAARISYLATLTAGGARPYFWRVREAAQAGDTPKLWSAGTFLFAPGTPAAGLPEGQISLTGTGPTDVRQGDEVVLPVAFANLSAVPFTDSLTVQQLLYTASSATPQTTQWRVKAPAPGDTLRFASRIRTEKLPGFNRVVLTVNPRLVAEHSFINNTLNLLLPVQPDVAGPVIEVAFDGARIADGEVVSARPVIEVLVADDNRALIRRDTTGVTLFLQRPGTTSPERLSWRTATVGPTAADNVFRVGYPSPPLADGRYQLLVTARDVVGNAASPYQIGFQVIQSPELTDLAVYPNPFREQTRFVFRLTGSRAPDAVSLTIYDLTGRRVRHLKAAQAGPGRRIGTNELAWDGRADSGEPLPAGVYVYRLQVSDTNQAWPVAGAVQSRLTGRIVLVR